MLPTMLEATVVCSASEGNISLESRHSTIEHSTTTVVFPALPIHARHYHCPDLFSRCRRFFARNLKTAAAADRRGKNNSCRQSRQSR